MTDSQLKPGYTPPETCPKGCARWDNLAADGNTRSQTFVNAQWSGGSPPPDAGNMCAQPAGNDVPNNGPWCYCAGTNDDSWGYCQNRNLGAAACKATPNGLNDLNEKLNECTSTTELQRNTNFATLTFNLNKDIVSLTGIVGDSLAMGDSMLGQFSYGDIIKQVKDRNTELKSKKENLVKEVEKKEAIIERSDRDFSDVNDTIPQPYPKRVLNFVEDYTLAALIMAYLFMVMAIIYGYTITSEFKLIGFGKAIVGTGFLSMFLGMLLFYLS
jgi:hypothetical protein